MIIYTNFLRVATFLFKLFRPIDDIGQSNISEKSGDQTVCYTMFFARKFTILHIALCRLYQIVIYSEEEFVRVWYITPALATHLFSVYYFTNAGTCSNI